jgi:hypothetical protein
MTEFGSDSASGVWLFNIQQKNLTKLIFQGIKSFTALPSGPSFGLGGCAEVVLSVRATMRQDAIRRRRDIMGLLLQVREDRREGRITAGL